MTASRAAASPCQTDPLPWAVYLHVPFCLRRCGYCDFATDALSLNPAIRRDRFTRYLTAARREILAGPDRGARTVFCGGGTPTTLAADELLGLLATVAGHGGIASSAEITTEANPTTAEAGLFGALRAGGFNRLSLGIQSFQDDLLAGLGRTHSGTEAVRAYELARAAGFDNVSVDLMFALPNQSLADWRETLRRALALEPDHVALYGLTVEPETPLAKQVASGRVRLLDEAIEADMYELAIETLGAAGFEHYEISNFARPGRRSEHNQIYWRNEEYRGYGPGAASYVGRRRWVNVGGLEAWCARIQTGDSAATEIDERDEAGEQRETMYLGLRRLEGVESEAFRRRFGVTPEALFADELARLVARGWMVQVKGHWRLTHRGLLLANQVFLEFV